MSAQTKLLQKEIEKFKAWAITTHPDLVFGRGEWEADYPEWQDLYLAALPLLRGEASLNDEETQLLLYAMARDNEVELLADEVPDQKLVKLAQAALVSSENDAKWQLTYRLVKLPFNSEIENLLLAFASDPCEYVRRRAMLTLAQCNSSHAARLAEEAWVTGDEYQRIAALHVFYRVKSPLLQDYLSLAIQDGRQYLVKNVENIRNGQERVLIFRPGSAC